MKMVNYLLVTGGLLLMIPLANADVAKDGRTGITTSSIEILADITASPPEFVEIMDQKGRTLFRAKFKGEPLSKFILKKNGAEIDSVFSDENGEASFQLKLDNKENGDNFSVMTIDSFGNISDEKPFIVRQKENRLEVKKNQFEPVYTLEKEPIAPWFWTRVILLMIFGIIKRVKISK